MRPTLKKCLFPVPQPELRRLGRSVGIFFVYYFLYLFSEGLSLSHPNPTAYHPSLEFTLLPLNPHKHVHPYTQPSCAWELHVCVCCVPDCFRISMEKFVWKEKTNKKFFDDFPEARLKTNPVGPHFFGSVGLRETKIF